MFILWEENWLRKKGGRLAVSSFSFSSTDLLKLSDQNDQKLFLEKVLVQIKDSEQNILEPYFGYKMLQL